MEYMADYDLARCLGREFGLVLSVVRLISGGGVAPLMGRFRLYQDKAFWGTAGDERYGRLPKEPFDHYFQRLYFDTGGFAGEMRALKASLLEMAPAQVLFGSDYPQEIRDPNRLGSFVRDARDLPLPAA